MFFSLLLALLVAFTPMVHAQETTYLFRTDDMSFFSLMDEVKKNNFYPERWMNEGDGELRLSATASKHLSPEKREQKEITFKANSNQQKPWQLSEMEKKYYTNISTFAGAGLISLYGVLLWGWGGSGTRFRTNQENWFERHTYAGGADKLAHMYSHFIFTRGFYNLYSEIGLNPQAANARAMAAAAGIGLFIEIGDGLSKYGFSVNDLIIDLAGVGLSGLLNAYPFLDELIGFQMQWWPTVRKSDRPHERTYNPIDDYNNQKYVLNLRASGTPYLRDVTGLRYLNLDFGYYTRGYGKDPENIGGDPEKYYRRLFVGFSINFWKLLEDQKSDNTAVNAAATTFKYWQTPFNAIRVKQHALE